MAGQILGSSGGPQIMAGQSNPFSSLLAASPIGQMAGGVQGVGQGLTQGLTNPIQQLIQSAKQGVQQGLPEVMPRPFVSQDERSSQADRTGIASQAAATPAQTPIAPPITDTSTIPPAVRAGIFKGESGGDYNTLYGHMERQGQPFAGTQLTNMTVDQALQFNSPQGPYGQWAARNGIAAAPLGAYQIVHKTLADAKAGLGLSGNELMSPQLQERMGNWIYQHQGTGAWAGYKGPADPSQVFQPGETLHVPSSRTGAGGGARQSPNAMGPGFGPNVTIPSGTNGIGGGDPNANTALAIDPNAQYTEAARKARLRQALANAGGQGVGPQLPQTRPPMQDQNNPAYQAVQAAQHGGHMRALPAVDVMKGLASIGKGYRDYAGSTYG